MQKKIVIGTRGSDLALWQARFLQNELSGLGHASELMIIKTQGDQIQHLSLEKLEGKGFFTKEIEDALLNNTIDVAVHSHKDLPTEFTPGLAIAAVSDREDPSELLLIRKECVDPLREFELKENAVIGTSSSRRKTQLQFYRPDLEIKDIRGNVPTRIQKLRNGTYDAILLATAGVKRLQLDCSDLHVIQLPLHKIIPAPAQGVLAYQCRAHDLHMIGVLKQLNHSDVLACIAVEREVMHLFKGGCHMPIGVYCKKEGNDIHTWAMQAGDDKLRRLFYRSDSVHNAAEKIFNTLRSTTQRSVFISTNASADMLFYKLLENSGFQVECKSLLEFKSIQIKELPKYDWLFFTSKNGVNFFFDQIQVELKKNIAAIGEETAKEINKRGYEVSYIGGSELELIATGFEKIAGGKTVLFPQAANANNQLVDLLKAKMITTQLPVYQNMVLPNCQQQDQDILVFTSALNVDAYFSSNQLQPHQHVVAIGSSTGKQLASKGIRIVHTPPFKSLISVADLICGPSLFNN